MTWQRRRSTYPSRNCSSCSCASCCFGTSPLCLRPMRPRSCPSHRWRWACSSRFRLDPLRCHPPCRHLRRRPRLARTPRPTDSESWPKQADFSLRFSWFPPVDRWSRYAPPRRMLQRRRLTCAIAVPPASARQWRCIRPCCGKRRDRYASASSHHSMAHARAQCTASDSVANASSSPDSKTSTCAACSSGRCVIFA